MNFEELMIQNAKGKPVNYDKTDIIINNNKELDSLDGIEKFKKLKSLQIVLCFKLSEIKNLPDSIEILRLGKYTVNNYRSNEILSIDRFPSNVKEIDLANNNKLAKIPRVPKTCESLNMSNTKIEDFDVDGGENLKDLNIEITQISKFENAYTKYPNLEYLTFGDTYIEKLENLPSSIKKINGCYTVNKKLNKLVLLDFSNLENIEKLHCYFRNGMSAKNLKEVKVNKHIVSLLAKDYDRKIFDFSPSELFVQVYLNKDSAERGAASIMDTGLFDFKQ